MEYIKKFEGFFDKDHIHDSMDVNIRGIFVDMIDDGFEIDMMMDNYASNISTFRISKRTNSEPFINYINYFEQFHNLLTYNKYKCFHISINGKWLLDKDYYKNATQFTGNWESISSRLIEEFEDKPFKSISIGFYKK